MATVGLLSTRSTAGSDREPSEAWTRLAEDDGKAADATEVGSATEERPAEDVFSDEDEALKEGTGVVAAEAGSSSDAVAVEETTSCSA